MTFFSRRLPGSSILQAYTSIAIAALILNVGFSDSLSAQNLKRTIPNPAPSVSANFGRNMMITNNGLIVTSGRAQVGNVENAGAVYLINPDTGGVILNIPNPEPDANFDARFGQFAWAGDTRLVASAFFKKDGQVVNSGRVYVFNLASGQFTRTILNPTPSTEDQFGYALGMMGDVAIISSRGDSAAGSGTGTVYLINTLSGELIRTIPNPAPTVQDNFGYSVAAVGADKILIGAPNNDIGRLDSGAVFLVNATTGQVIHKIINPDPADTAYFGFQVRAHGEDLLVGAPGSNKAYLFDGQTGTLIHRFENPSFQMGAVFGSTVASAGNYILVGNPYEPFGDKADVGKAYLFSAATGALVRTIINPSPERDDRFGVSVVGVNGNLLVSADLKAVGNVSLAGSLYLYQGIPAAARGDWNLYQ